MVPVTIKDGNTRTYARSGKPFRETALKFKQKLVCVRFCKSVKYTNLVPCSNKEMAFFQAVYLSTRMENRHRMKNHICTHIRTRCKNANAVNATHLL